LFIVRLRLFSFDVRTEELRALVTLGLRLHLGNVAFLVASRVDIVALSFLASSRVLGAYVVAAAVGALPLVIPAAASLVLYPLFSRRGKANADRPFARFILLAGLTTIVGVPIVILISPLILRWFFGNAFGDATATAQLLGIASLLRGTSVMASAVLRGLGAPVRASVGDIAGLVVMVVCIVPGIRIGGGVGAAVTVLLGTVIALAWMTYHGMRVVRLSPMELVRVMGKDFRHTGPERGGAK
jgi:O-antigen/teichoic acid export membrane protein